MSTKPYINPFRVGTAIQDPTYFVGRKEVLRSISGAMLNLQNVSLHGERRTGKTSLLLYMMHPASATVLGLLPNHIPVYFDFQALTQSKAVTVWQAIANAIAKQIEQRLPDEQAESARFRATMARLPQVPDLLVAGLGHALSDLGSSGFKIHLLFDEFEQTRDNPHLRDPFYDALRSLPTRAGNISYVIATRTGLADLQPVYNKISSPFFNIFTPLILPPFGEDEVIKLMDTYLGRAGLDILLTERLRAQSSLLYEVTGYHPFFVQMLCYHLFERLGQPDWPLGQAEQEALQAFKKDSDPHFQYYWDVSDAKEQVVIEKLATGQSIGQDALNVAKSLEDRCLSVPAESGWQLFSTVFADWVKDRQFRSKCQLLPQHRKNEDWTKVLHLATDLAANYKDRIDDESIADARKIALYSRGKQLLDENESESAFQHLYQLYEEDSDYKDVATLCATVAFQTGMRRDAPTSKEHQVEWLEKAVEIAPNHQEGRTQQLLNQIRLHWAEELLATNEPAAIAQLEKIVPSYTDRSKAYRMLVDAYHSLLRAGNYERTESTNLDAEAEARYCLGVELWGKGDTQGATEQFTAILSQTQEFRSAQLAVAKIYEMQGDREFRRLRFIEAIRQWLKSSTILGKIKGHSGDA